MAASNPEPSQELDFPPVRVDHSIEKLDLNSLIMRSKSNTRPQAEETTSLEDSTYEVVGMADNDLVTMSDSVYETSDDEGHTASVASTTPDDASTFDDDEEDDDFVQYADEPTLPLDNSTIETTDHNVPAPIDDSALTEVPYMGQSGSLSEIKMEEEPQADQGLTNAWAITKEFTAAQTAEGVLKPYECLEMRLTVRAALSDFHMPARTAFKILYIGNIADWARVDVESCISKALNASPGPSRSIMRHGQMEPYGPILSSDHCTHLKRLDAAAKTSDVLVTFDDGMELTFGTPRKYSTAQSSRLPDLVVFWYPHPRLTALELDNFPAACEAFGRHQIPSLHVAEDRRFHHHSLEPVGNSKSIQLCVEGKNDDSEEFVLKESIPIDLYTLQNLDSSQLNRHLVALDPRITSPKPTSHSEPWSREYCLGYISRAVKSTTQFPHFKVTFLLGLLTVVLSSYFVAPLATSLLQGNTPPMHDDVIASLSNALPLQTQTLSQSLSTAASAVSSESALPTSRGLSIVLPLQKLPSARLGSRKTDQSIFYDIQMTGEHQFTLSPDKELVDRKGKPQLQIQVTKDTETVPIRYTRTMNGAYVVELEQEYPVGLFNVTIATHTKPLKMQQWFAVNMGHNKTMVAQFVHIFNRDVAATQQSLKKMSSILSEHANAMLSRAESNLNEWKKHAHLPNVESTEGIRKTQEEIQRQVASGIDKLQKTSIERWVDVQRVTAPVRTSKAVLRARHNAFHIRCRFEEALGLSETKQDGEKSRACQHAGRQSSTEKVN